MAFRKHYLKDGRLANIIALISVLGPNETGAFQTEEQLEENLFGKPNDNTGRSWLAIAREHPEFFRVNGEKNEVILLLRNSSKQKGKDGHTYPALSLDQVQKLIEHAVNLSDTQKPAIEKWGTLITIIPPILAVVASLLIARGTSAKSDEAIARFDKKLDSLARIYSQPKTHETNLKNITSANKDSIDK